MTNKGFEPIDRAFLQDSDLSLEAIGLMCNIESYSDNWILHKTELYTRFKKNGRTSIDRCWDELVENGYILQFRRREGKSYNYQYCTSTTKFSRDQIISMAEKLKEDGFEFYHKNAKHFSSFNLVALIDSIFKPEVEEEAKTRYVERKQIDFNSIISSFRSTVQNQQSNMNSSFRASKRKPITKSFNKEIDEDDIYKIAAQFSSPAVKTIAEKLIFLDIDDSEAFAVITFLSEQHDLDIEAANQQLNWMIIKSKDETGISSFSEYFKNGYLKRTQNRNISNNSYDSSEELPKIPMFNWMKCAN